MWSILKAQYFLQGQGKSSGTSSFPLILQFMCLGWEDAYKMNVARLPVLLTLYWKPPVGEELRYTCLYMKDPMRRSKNPRIIVQLENLVWSLWGQSSSNAWKLLGFFTAWRNRTWHRTTLRCQATLENLLHRYLYVFIYIAIDP